MAFDLKIYILKSPDVKSSLNPEGLDFTDNEVVSQNNDISEAGVCHPLFFLIMYKGKR